MGPPPTSFMRFFLGGGFSWVYDLHYTSEGKKLAALIKTTIWEQLRY